MGITELFWDDDTFVWRCGKCYGPMRLPGYAPDISTLYIKGWKYCPYCGKQIYYTKKQKERFNDHPKND